MEACDVVIIGAGLSGIGAARYLQQRCPWASFTILEQRQGIGGTWDLFRYPGVRSDSDMYTLGYSFKPWRGDTTLADGPSILAYVREAATETGVDRHIRFGHTVRRLAWSSEAARWTVIAEQADGSVLELEAHFVFGCTGYYRYDRGHAPTWPGMDRFAGTVVHPQHWPDELDHAGRRVVVIGSGATAVTLVPALAETAAHVTMLQRSPTYVAAVPQRDHVALALRRVVPAPHADRVIRWAKALINVVSYTVSRRRPDGVRRLLTRQAAEALPAGFPVDVHFSPSYQPWDQRMCAIPDGDLFRAIRQGRADVVTDTIDAFTEDGVRLASGRELPADIVVSATGLELLFLGGVALEVDGAPVEVADRLVYRGMMLEGVPNLAVAVGYTNASWTLKCDLTCDWVCRLLTRMRRTGSRQVTPVNADPAVTPAPLLPLRSGYVLRSAHRLPKAGSRQPWVVHQNYLRDWRAMRRPIADPELVFSPPVTAADGVPA